MLVEAGSMYCLRRIGDFRVRTVPRRIRVVFGVVQSEAGFVDHPATIGSMSR